MTWGIVIFRCAKSWWCCMLVIYSNTILTYCIPTFYRFVHIWIYLKEIFRLNLFWKKINSLFSIFWWNLFFYDLFLDFIFELITEIGLTFAWFRLHAIFCIFKNFRIIFVLKILRIMTCFNYYIFTFFFVKDLLGYSSCRGIYCGFYQWKNVRVLA